MEYPARTSPPPTLFLLLLQTDPTGLRPQGFVAIPKSVSQARIQENAQIFDFELDEEDMKQVRLILRPAALVDCMLTLTVQMDALDEYLVTDWDVVDEP